MANAVDYNITPQLRSDLAQWRTRALIAGVVGAAISAAGDSSLAGPDQFYRSYLWSFMFIVGLTIGSLAWLMLQYVTGGAWGLVIRRSCEAATRTLPLVLADVPSHRDRHQQLSIPGRMPPRSLPIRCCNTKAPYLNVPLLHAAPPSTSPAGCSLAWWFNRCSARGRCSKATTRYHGK